LSFPFEYISECIRSEIKSADKITAEKLKIVYDKSLAIIINGFFSDVLKLEENDLSRIQYHLEKIEKRCITYLKEIAPLIRY